MHASPGPGCSHRKVPSPTGGASLLFPAWRVQLTSLRTPSSSSSLRSGSVSGHPSLLLGAVQRSWMPQTGTDRLERLHFSMH